MAVESFQSPPQSGSGGRARPASRRSQTVFTSLERDILLGTLAPNQPLLELEIASRFNCSQGTVREALLQLQEEGLVLRMAHRGTRVADCNEDDARELLLVRHDLECRAIARTMTRPVRVLPTLREELEAMREAARAEDEYRLSIHDRRFHMALYEAADLPAVLPILSRCLIHNHRYKIINSSPNRALTETADRHVVIIEAIAAGDVEAARAALSHHIATIGDLGPKIFDRNTPR
ncbi:GntR family transcriptional regulator [Acuticoccus mangrovi]|uniref:GntR family transcriptional regulator n=1 Tax=Acuticoccus mangrovi TaxID=2796142 RepID=A0A934IMW5_9HYPH|nr:GntR family transcriptional regulator [Acuticoccus mangrovi]MBJ3774309.1 GntR family transcriptional regulator [Acuticoccus mangrovi]